VYHWCVLHSSPPLSSLYLSSTILTSPSYIRHLICYRIMLSSTLLYSTLLHSTQFPSRMARLRSSSPLLSSPLSRTSYLTSYSTLFYSTLLYFPLGRQDCVLPRGVQRVSEHRTISAVKRRQHKHHRQGTLLHYNKLYCSLSIIKMFNFLIDFVVYFFVYCLFFIHLFNTFHLNSSVQYLQ
jgi:hypothetical protein